MKYLVICTETREISTEIEASDVSDAETKMKSFKSKRTGNWKVIEDEIKFIKLFRR